MLAAAGRDSPRRATSFLAARQERRQRNVPCSQRPRPPRVAGQSGQPALGANAGVRWNSLRAKALRSSSHRKSVHEVWLSCGSQTAGVYSERRRWLKGVGKNSQQLARVVLIASVGGCCCLSFSQAVSSLAPSGERVGVRGQRRSPPNIGCMKAVRPYHSHPLPGALASPASG